MGTMLVLSGVIGLIHPQAAHAASTFTVDSTLDTVDNTPGDNTCDDGAGNCTLRAAIEEANANANPSEQDTITFALTGPADFTNGGQDGYTFSPASPYANIVEPVVIDGYSQIGAAYNTAAYPAPLNGVLLIEIDGTLLSSAAIGVGADQVRLTGMIMGGVATPNQPFISVSGSNTQIFGNYIGTDPTGMTARPNYIGILMVAGSGAAIGSSSAADRNLISGNSVGMDLLVSGATIQGNFIGPNAAGAITSLSTTQTPLVLLNGVAHDNLVGGTGSQDGNIIAGGASGILAYGSLANGYPAGNGFIGNSIYGNAQSNGILGIDLALDANGDFQPDSDFGANPNDAGDVDTGANDYLNTPVIHSAVYDAAQSTLFVHYDLDVAGSPSDTYRVEFYANDTNTPGEGKTLVSIQDSVSAGSDQVNSFQPYNSFDPTGKYITATVTQQDGSFSNQGFGSTSEFSAPAAVSEGVLDLDITKTLTNPNDIRVGGSANYDVTVTNNGQTAVPLTLNDNGFGVYDIFPPGLTFADASGDALLGCQQIPDQDAQEFLGYAAVNHQSYQVLVCAPGRSQPLMPGESTTFHLQFTIDSIPVEGFANYTLVFNLQDPDFIALSALSNGGETPLDIIDLFAAGTIGGNGNVAYANYTPTSGGSATTTLAKSGASIGLYAALAGLLALAPAIIILRRRSD